MITVANRINVKPEYADAFEQRFAERAGLVDGMPGFISNQVLRPANPDDPYVVLTFWESREAFEAWTRSDAFRASHAKPKTSGRAPTYLEPPQFEGFEVLQEIKGKAEAA